MEAYNPLEVGTFSINKQGLFVNCNRAELPKLKPFKLPLDLNEGYVPRLPGAPTEPYISKFPLKAALEWICETGYDCLDDVDVVTRRGILNQIGITEYNTYKNPWTFEATKYKGKLYIREPDIIDESYNEWGMKNSYWGQRFEDLVTKQESDVEASYRVLKGKLGGKNVLLSAEVDAVNSRGENLEIKTCFEDKLRQKIPSFWLQSYLGNIDVLYIAYKDRITEGTVQRDPVQFKMSEIPGGNKFREMTTTKANSMINFTGKIINRLYREITEEDVTWSLVYNGGRVKDIELSKKEGTGSFLPGWYRVFVNDSIKQNQLVEQAEALSLKHSSH